MLHRGSLSPFKSNIKIKEDIKCKYEPDKRSFKKITPILNYGVEKHHLSSADGKYRSSISKFSKDEKSHECKEDTSKRIYAIKRGTFQPEIHLSNRIIEDLTSKHKAELLHLRHSRGESRKVLEESGKKIPKVTPKRDVLECSKERMEKVGEGNRKAVTFLDDKLKNGFTNAGFVLSPPSISETDKKESCEGIINDGFISSPVSDANGVKNRSVRPKPIILPSEELLLQLNRRSPERGNSNGPEEGICNEGFVQSPDCATPEFVASHMTNRRSGEFDKSILSKGKTPRKIGRRKEFVNNIKKFSSRKSSSNDNENTSKCKKLGLLSRRKSGKAAVPSEEIKTKREIVISEGSKKEESAEVAGKCEKGKTHERSESFTCSKLIHDGNSPGVSIESVMVEVISFNRHYASGKCFSMSKLPTERKLNDDEHEEDFQNRSDTFELDERGMDFWVDGFKINNKKKVDKINKINIHLHALFSAVENGHVEKARTILESSDVDVNTVNGDNLTPLDVAVLTNHRPLAKMLVAFGAQEGNHFQSPEKLGNHLKSLSMEAERRVQELNGGLLTPEQGLSPNLNNNRASFSIISHYPTSSITCHGGSGDSEKELLIWERRCKGLKKMLLGFDQTRPPDVPFLVAVDVTGTNSVTVRYQGPEHQDSSICTKFKVEWSERENFDVLAGEKEITDVKCLECCINGLTRGKRYWFRVACGNLKGYGNYKSSTPPSVVPSSWRDVQGREPRFAGRLQQLEDLFADIRNLRPETASEIKDFSDQEKQGDAPAVQRRNQKKKTIKQLFTVTGKFQKNLKRGVYLVCLFFHEDKILVTNEDFLPAIEVDETYPSSIYNDLHWFMKVACTWNDVKSLKQDMEKNLTSTTSHFRIKLLQAAQQMQSSLCTQDLGQLYYKPIRDAQGTLVFCSVNSCPSLKSISVLNLRWTPISKVQKKIVASEESNVGELLMASIQTQIAYYQVSNLKLSKGLYLGYLKMKSSVDLIQIIVPSKTPNVLPHCKVRDNPHVSSDEWEWLKRINSRHKSLENLPNQGKDVREFDLLKGTEQQQTFVEQVANTARRLFSYMDVSLEDAMLHRLYDIEVVDLNSNVSFLIVVPPVETSCSVPGQKDILLERGDLMSVSLQVFEMVHLGTYQPEVISRYSRLSCILELDIILAQHSHREAFSSSEVQVAKDRLAKLQDLQIQLNGVWKSVRWIMDVITFARDRGSSVSSGSLQANQKATVMGNSQTNLNKIHNHKTSSLSLGVPSCGIQNMNGVPMKHLLALTKKKEGNKKSPNRVTKSKCLKENHQYSKCEKRSLLQIPDSPKDPKISKSNASRGSWPGPGVENSSSLLESSFSKSEQHLNILGEKTFGNNSPRKFSDCSSSDEHYLNKQSISNSSAGGQQFAKCGGNVADRDAMTNIGNRLQFSRSEDHLFLSQELRSFKQSKDHKNHRNRASTAAATSVSASNSPLLPQRNLYGNNLNRMEIGSSLSIANTNTSGSLHSISSDESTAAVVSLPVTTPFRSGVVPTALSSVQHSASLMSLAKPVLPKSGANYSKPKIPVTVSLNSLSDVANVKRTTNPPSNLITSGSILSGNTIPVNINQKPLKTAGPLLDTDILQDHISSSLPSFSKHSGCDVTNLLANINPFASSVPGNPRIQSPVKSPIKAVSPIDTVLSSASAIKRSSGISVDPFIAPTLPPDIDLLQHPGLPLDAHNSNSSFTSTAHNSKSSGPKSEMTSEPSSTSSGFLTSAPTTSHDKENEDDQGDLGNGVKIPSLSSGVLQVYAAYETGLAAGTSLKLHVTPRTSAREVVDLVVKQLNMAVLLKGKDGPIYPAEKLKNFCLVAVIGARERCLRDDFKPLQLQNPWKKGRLYVRQKQDVLAALEHSSRQSAFL